MWKGSAAICVNENKEILMVLQGKQNEQKKWSIPTGGKEENETFEECCIREVKEETGYQVIIDRKFYEKNGMSYGLQIHVHYYIVTVVGGERMIQDPDNLIYEIEWKSIEDLINLELTFPEDRALIINLLNKHK